MYSHNLHMNNTQPVYAIATTVVETQTARQVRNFLLNPSNVLETILHVLA